MMSGNDAHPHSRFRAALSYDGTAYHGFQRQAGETPTIQGAVENALNRVTGKAITIIGAGRTDAGVHASGQIIAFDVDWRHEPGDLLRALNANLPKDIALTGLTVAEAGFHPRFDAMSRRYEYRFYRRRIRHPLWDRYQWQIMLPLDITAMQQAATLLLGEHDFSTFGQPTQPGGSTIRRVTESALTVTRSAEGELGCYTVAANAFLQRMVRSMMGTLVAVGQGAMTIETFAAALHAADRQQAGPTAPPNGLTLVHVAYD